MSKITKEQELNILFDVFADKIYEDFDPVSETYRQFEALSKDKFLELVKVYFSKEGRQ